MENLDASVLFLKLRNMGIEKVRVDFSGGGDSGDITDTEYLDDKGNVLDIDIHKEAISELCSETLLNNIEDWWNNDGGFGTVKIDVNTGDYTIDNHIRITEIEDYSHEGSLIEEVN